MNSYFFVAGIMAAILGIIHSVLGEFLIFRHLRGWSRRDEKGQEILQPHHLRTLWSTWHLLTLFGWGIAATFFWMAFPSHILPTLSMILAAFMGLGALFWMIGTRARHPAWIVLLLICATVLGATYGR